MRFAYCTLAVVAMAVTPGCATVCRPTAATGVPQVRVKPECTDDDGLLVVHTLIEIDVRYDDANAKLLGKRTDRWRTLLHLQCPTDTGKCVGAVAPLEAFEAGREIAIGDFHILGDLRIAGRTSKVYTLTAEQEPPPGSKYKPSVQSFSVNLETRKVEFRKTGGIYDARGTGACGPAPPRQPATPVER